MKNMKNIKEIINAYVTLKSIISTMSMDKEVYQKRLRQDGFDIINKLFDSQFNCPSFKQEYPFGNHELSLEKTVHDESIIIIKLYHATTGIPVFFVYHIEDQEFYHNSRSIIDTLMMHDIRSI